ncbi:MAG: sensor histidine kinase [Saprospiraceae bacterium]
MTTQEKIQNHRLELLLHLGIWTLFILVHALIFTRFLTFEISLLRSFANVVPMALIFYINFILINRYLEKRDYLRYGIFLLCLFLAATLLRTEINMLFPDIRKEVIVLEERQGWGIGAAITNLSVLILSIFYQILYNRYRNEQRNLAIINEQKEAQLQFLRAQINPHFLFNTLNNIYALAVTKSDKTAEMVLKLSNLLRYVIYDGKAEQVELKREVEHIQEFIHLFQMKSETSLAINFTVKGNLNFIKIEPMILIPIVENCFKHCDFDTNMHAFIKIDLVMDNNILHFQTINTKNDQDLQKDKVGGVGLENIRKRLEMKYKDQHQLIIERQKDQFLVDLTLHL